MPQSRKSRISSLTNRFRTTDKQEMTFVKGKSGNPGGRPKKDNEITLLAQEECAAAIQRLAFWRDSGEARASVAASVALLDRGLGKPPQSIAHSGHIARTHEEELETLDNPDAESDDATREGTTS